MENKNQLDNFFNVGIDPAAHENLRTAATWAKVVAIVAFISAGLSVVTAFLGRSTTAGPAGMISTVIGSLVAAAISIAVNFYLLKFANNTTSGLNIRNQEQFNEGINNLRIYFKILGIMIIIALSLLTLFTLFFILGRGMA